MDRAKVNGVELEYEVRGAGEPVLLIDMLIPDCFVPLVREPALADGHRLIRYHKRGWIGSTHTPPPLTIADHVHVSSFSLVTRSILKPGHYTGVFPIDENSAWEKNAASLKQLHALRDQAMAGVDVAFDGIDDILELPFSITLNLPLVLPLSGIHSCSMCSEESLSMKRMNSRASKFLMSLPFLKLSNSSSTVIGMATSCCSKFLMAL